MYNNNNNNSIFVVLIQIFIKNLTGMTPLQKAKLV